MVKIKLFREVLVCFDVSETKRRNELIKKLKDIGLVRIQESVFWGYANQGEQNFITRYFSEILDKSTGDKAFIIPVDLSIDAKKNTFGYENMNWNLLSKYEIV